MKKAKWINIKGEEMKKSSVEEIQKSLKDNEIDGIEKLVKKGFCKGYVTFDDLQEAVEGTGYNHHLIRWWLSDRDIKIISG